jgi:hypothetical protein
MESKWSYTAEYRRKKAPQREQRLNQFEEGMYVSFDEPQSAITEEQLPLNYLRMNS